MSFMFNQLPYCMLNSWAPGNAICRHETWSALTLQWRHNGRDSVSNHQSHNCLLNRLFRRRSKKTSNLRVTGEFTGDRWIPRTNGQEREKCFHLMTSSWFKLWLVAWRYQAIAGAIVGLSPVGSSAILMQTQFYLIKPLDKMAATLADDIFKWIFLNEQFSWTNACLYFVEVVYFFA